MPPLSILSPKCLHRHLFRPLYPDPWFEMRHDFKIPNLIFNKGDDPALNQYGQGLPTTVFLNQNDKVVYLHVGEISNALLNTKIKELLNEKERE